MLLFLRMEKYTYLDKSKVIKNCNILKEAGVSWNGVGKTTIYTT